MTIDDHSQWLSKSHLPLAEIGALAMVMSLLVFGFTQGQEMALHFPTWDGQTLNYPTQQIHTPGNSELFVP